MCLILKEKTVPILEKPKISGVIKGLAGKFKTGRFNLWNSSDDSFCILGALGFAGGMSREQIRTLQYVGIEKIYPQLRDLVTIDGIQRDLMSTLFNLNDYGCTWNEIADKVEELGY